MTTTLLAVDDSVTMRRVLEITFGGESYRTVLASSASEALSLARSEKPSLVLLDHTLPDMSGYDLCRELKGAVPNLAVVMLSSKLSPYDKGRGTASGVDDFMDKPFDTQKLLDKIALVLSQPRAAAHAAAPAAASPAPVAAAPAPVAPAPAKPRSQTLAYGTNVGPASASPKPPAVATPAASRTLTGTPAPASVAAAPRPAAAAAPAPAPAAAAAPRPAAVAAVAVAATGQLSGQLASLGLSPAQAEGVLALSREVIEKVVWEVVPVLAETLIKEEIRRLTAD